MKQKKIMAAALAVIMLISLIPAAAFASNVPVTLTAAPVSLTVTVTESIQLTRPDATKADLAVTDLTVTSGMTAGSVEITNMEVNTQNGWTLTTKGDSFESMAANSKKLYMGYGSHDFTAGDLELEDVLAPSESKTYSLSAKTGITTQAISNEQVANVVLTIGLVDAGPAMIEFTINGTPYQAEEGMTWEEWAESDYNDSLIYHVLSDYIMGHSGNVVRYDDTITDVLKTETIIDGHAYYNQVGSGGIN